MSSTGNAVAAMPPSDESTSVGPVNPVNPGKQAARKPCPLNEHFKTFVCETLEKWHIQGVSVAVVDGDETFAEV